MHGVIADEDYAAFVRHFAQVAGSGPATATRLLALKRPDWFVPWNTKSQRALCGDFQIVRQWDYRRYWTDVIGRLQHATWWCAPEPAQMDQAELWRGRAALLDALYYDWGDE